MAYNPYNDINQIYKLKGQWNDANKNNDSNKKNDIAKKAQEYYAKLRSNNYGGVADELAGSNYDQSKIINNYYAKTGRTETRPYLYSVGNKYGLSQNDVDKLIKYDNDTGEISFGGKSVGKPDAVVNGTSYWSDTSVLDNAVNDYIARSGKSQPKSMSVAQENDSLFKKYNQEYEDLKNTNPFTTEEAKSILAKYDLAGLQGRDNAAASGASSNGGNIDSFSAANALRQQSALVNQGQQAVLSAYQQKLDHARNLLSDMGVNIDRVYNQDETTKNNDLSRDIAVSELTGKVHPNLRYNDNPYFNKDGDLINENIDYQSIVDAASEKLKNAVNASEKADLEATIKYAKQARAHKVLNNPAYAKYADTISLYAPDETADFQLSKEQLASNERMADKTNQNQLDLLEKEAEMEIKKNQAKSSPSNPQILAYNHNQSSSGGNSSFFSGSSNNKSSQTGLRTDSKGTYMGDIKVGDKNGKPLLTLSQAQSLAKNGDSSPQIEYCLNYYGASAPASDKTEKTDATYVGNVKVGDKNGKPILTLEQAQKEYEKGNLSPQVEYALKYNGITPNIANTLDKDDIDDIAKALNEDIKKRYGDRNSALVPGVDGKYKPGTVDVDYIIKEVLQMDEYTDSQKKYILQDRFGVTDKQIDNVLRDSHY